MESDEDESKNMDQDANKDPKAKNNPKNVKNDGLWYRSPPSIMSIISWNCRGLGTLWTVQFLKDIIIQKKPKIVFFVKFYAKQTRWKGSRMD